MINTLVVKLAHLYKLKRRIFTAFFRLRVIAQALAENRRNADEDDVRNLIGKKLGFNELATLLLDANLQLVFYEDKDNKTSRRQGEYISVGDNILLNFGDGVFKVYKQMMVLVGHEQRYLQTSLMPTFKKIIKNEHSEDWQVSFAKFPEMLEWMKHDLGLFEVLLVDLNEKGHLDPALAARESKRAEIKSQLILLIGQGKLVDSKRIIIDLYHSNYGWFDSSELNLINRLVSALETNNGQEIKAITDSKFIRHMFNEREHNELINSISAGQVDDWQYAQDNSERLKAALSSKDIVIDSGQIYAGENVANIFSTPLNVRLLRLGRKHFEGHQDFSFRHRGDLLGIHPPCSVFLPLSIENVDNILRDGDFEYFVVPNFKENEQGHVTELYPEGIESHRGNLDRLVEIMPKKRIDKVTAVDVRVGNSIINGVSSSNSDDDGYVEIYSKSEKSSLLYNPSSSEPFKPAFYWGGAWHKPISVYVKDYRLFFDERQQPDGKLWEIKFDENGYEATEIEASVLGKEKEETTTQKPSLGRSFQHYAIAVYQALLRGEKVGQQPIYLKVGRKTHERPEFAPVVWFFEEISDPSTPFIALTKSNQGFLFPTHRIYYVETMSEVFPELTKANYERVKPNIKPIQIRKRTDGFWEIVSEGPAAEPSQGPSQPKDDSAASRILDDFEKLLGDGN